MKKSSLTFLNQDGGEVRTFGNEKDKEGKHLGWESIRPMSIWPSLSFSFLLVVGGWVRSCFTLFSFKIFSCGQ